MGDKMIPIKLKKDIGKIIKKYPKYRCVIFEKDLSLLNFFIERQEGKIVPIKLKTKYSVELKKRRSKMGFWNKISRWIK